MRSTRRCVRLPLGLGLAVSCLFAGSAGATVAGEPLAGGGGRPATHSGHELLPRDPLLVVEIRRPARVLEHPLVRAIRDELEHSREFQARREAPEFDRLRAVQQFLKQTTGLEWSEAFDRLTAGGIVAAATKGEPPKSIAIVTAADAEVLDRFVAGTRDQILARVPEAFRPAVFVASEHNGATVWRVGQAWYAVVDRRFLLANDGDLVKGALDRLAESGEVGLEWLATPSLITASLSLDALRKAPALEQPLQLPAEDGGAIAVAGGWLDLIRTGDALTADLSLTEEAIELAVRLTGGRGRVTEGLAGFFATRDDDRALPLLELPGTLYTATWFRDYAALWDNRAKLLTESAVRKIEEGDEAIRKQFSVFKIDFAPSELLNQSGTHFRFVIARQQRTAYRVELEDKLPASALVVTLRDAEKFARLLVPLTRALGLVATFDQGVSTRESEHRGAQLVGWWFRDDPQAVASANRARYNFNPTYAITRGHFLFGSTREIVEQVIDELDRQADEGAEPLGAHVTERQSLSLIEVSRALEGVRESFVRGLAIHQGLTLDEAEREFEVLAKAVAVPGRITSESTFTDEAFEYRLRIAPVPAGKLAEQ